MSTYPRRIAAFALAGALLVSVAACSDDSSDDDATNGEEATTTTEPTTSEPADSVETTLPATEIAALDEIDACGLVLDVDIESVLGDEAVEPTSETAPALPEPTLSSDAELVESAGCVALSSEVTDAGLILRLFRYPTAEDATAVVGTLTDGEELSDTQADAAAIARFDVPAGFSYVLAGSTGDVVVVVQAQSIPDLTDPATQVSTLNSIVTGLQDA